MKCDHVHLFLMLCLQFLRHTKHTHPHTYVCCHARFHDSWLPLCLKVFICAKLHKLLCDVTGRHYNTRISDVSLARAHVGQGVGSISAAPSGPAFLPEKSFRG